MPISPQSPHNTLSLLLLAGGRGERLGGQDKGLLTVDGKTFVERLLLRFAPKVSEVLISANRYLDRYQQLAAPWHAKVLQDDVQGFHGPLSGILTGLKNARTDWVLVLPCDAQVLPNDLLEKLRGQQEQTGARAVFAAVDGQDQPLACLLLRSLAEQLEKDFLAGERSVIHWLISIGAQRCEFRDDAKAHCWSINTPEDLARLAAQIIGEHHA
jgi:molybdopterin-guanine dinucleotide biosynthesis protein A